MTKKLTIGFIGAGLMGHGIAKNLLLAGYPLILMGHKNRAPIDDLVRQGAVEAHSPGEIASKVDMLFLCVTSSAVVETLMSGDNGIIQAGRPGLIVVDASTGDPAATIALGARLSSRGIHLVDAPLTRTPREAEDGRLNILISGKPDIVAQVHEVATSFCENIFEIGELGSALKLKLINNLLSLGHAVLAAEAVNAARATGVDLAKLHAVVSRGGANSAAFGMIVSHLLEGDDTGMQFSMRNARKDLGCYRRMVEGTDLMNLLAGSAYDAYNLATIMGHGEKLLSQMSGIFSAEHLAGK
ncbi:NAD(P)-dependent oxidoreductase [Castellaniella sp.]|uniref:NAD(P)-dependent oxidoreductase n=1 Tax=Castellaniella sp. TaxID=1955812 RepID=UPI0025BB960D|nr:NAD(P)-dependent oxidoreductase [Castellaniella sp.]